MVDGTVETSQYPGHQSVFSPPSPTTTPYVSLPPPGGICNNSSSSGAMVQWILSLMGSGGGEDEVKRWSSFIGIIVAISGNVPISLALSVQKYAYICLRREKTQRKRLLRRRWKEQAWKSGIGPAGQPGTGWESILSVCMIQSE